MAMDPEPPRYYHTRLDTPDILDPTCIATALRVVVAFVERLDAAASSPAWKGSCPSGAQESILDA